MVTMWGSEQGGFTHHNPLSPSPKQVFGFPLSDTKRAPPPESLTPEIVGLAPHFHISVPLLGTSIAPARAPEWV
jgi:hypothetical protein